VSPSRVESREHPQLIASRTQGKNQTATDTLLSPTRTFYCNVVQMPKGDCYCCTPVTRVPISDLMLSQKLLLEADPEQFFKIANRKAHLIIDVPAALTVDSQW
jgi:hypothetical protein